jgi:hypothetical protein
MQIDGGMVVNLNNIRVMFKGKEYIILHQSSTGYCEIIEIGGSKDHVQLVHFSELVLIK